MSIREAPPPALPIPRRRKTNAAGAPAGRPFYSPPGSGGRGGALRRSALRASSLVLLLVLVACGQPAASGQGKAPWPGPFTPVAASPTPVPPVAFPRDEGPHEALTEWWYYTGHLKGEDGTAYGFESVVFQSRRSDLPPFYAAHVAITDHARTALRYDQRSGAAQVGSGPGFDLRMGDWAWRGLEGRDQLAATIPGYAFELDLTATKPPALHDGGYIEFGPAGGSYYYSRTRMEVRGVLEDNGVRKTVSGLAWFDHQWGNFLPVVTGGWDWFSAQLADGSDFTLSLLRGPELELVGAYGTFVAPDGRDEYIGAEDIRVEALSTWTSPHTGFTYPASWRITLPKQGLVLVCTPVFPDQELDTRASTGNVYWEGEVRFAGTRDGAPLRGEGYVELTGYDRK